MKRKLNRAAQVDKIRRERQRAVEESGSDEEVPVEEAVAEESEEDSESDTGFAPAGGSSDEADSEDEGAAAPAKKRVKGALSESDSQIMKKRLAEEEAIARVVPYRNKQRTLVFCSRGVTSRFRHLMEDIRSLLPHHRKEVKHDTKRNLHEINGLCDMKDCNNCIFFEARKSKDLYMWLCKTPNGPSAKFHVLNVHTMDELRLSGNCLKGSRPMLSFAKEFETEPALQLLKELFTHVFGTPAGHPKSKPFVDHVMTFSILDGKIWFRHFQIVDSTQDAAEIRAMLKQGEESIKLVEIGPRFVLNLIKIFDGSFGGRTLQSNPYYVTPNAVRSAERRKKGNVYVARKKAEHERAVRSQINVLPEDEIRTVFK
mmetsp:Transcript_15466/g.38956  ORF Transcript_15466/g.38956 Transcript_15466/m.38956 type:complete len:371 (-) Transcript_15466:152-1264(-)